MSSEALNNRKMTVNDIMGAIDYPLTYRRDLMQRKLSQPVLKVKDDPTDKFTQNIDLNKFNEFMEKRSNIVRKQFNREEGAMWSASSERFSKKS